jgi:hypothetical protein
LKTRSFSLVCEEVASRFQNNRGLDIETAKTHISYFIQSASTSQIDMMDHYFIHGPLSHAPVDHQACLLVYYAWFKIHELARYQQFRGFPRIDE